MAETGEEMARKQDGGNVASWLNTPSYSPNAPENAELPWTLKPPPPPAEPTPDHDFVVVPRDGVDAPPDLRGTPRQPSSDPNHWSVRESSHNHEPIVIPINEALIPKPPPPPRLQRMTTALLVRWDRATPRQRLGIT